MRLESKTVLITGGAAGIGKATVARFAEEGANVVICDRYAEAGQTTVGELDIRFDEVNITDRQAVGAWVDSVAAACGSVDIADAYPFLASDEAGFISGVTFRADDGFVIGT
jgi:3-oxoacyl-[acyl-carrier protein] reductase